MHIGIGRTIGSFVEVGIRWVVVASSRQTNSFVMGGSNARGPGGMRATAIKCWHFAVPNITAPSIRSLSVISNDYGKRKIHRMLPFDTAFGLDAVGYFRSDVRQLRVFAAYDAADE